LLCLFDFEDGHDTTDYEFPDTYISELCCCSSSLAKTSPVGNKEEVRVLASPRKKFVLGFGLM